MPTHDNFGWRDRAIALASLGAAALSRRAFTTVDVINEKPLRPLQMQVLVALALQDSPATEPPLGSGTDWLSRALSVESSVVEELVGGLEQANLVRRSSDAHDVGEIQDGVTGTSDAEVVAEQRAVVVTELGLQIVDGWLGRTRRHFGGWPPSRPDVDDAVG